MPPGAGAAGGTRRSGKGGPGPRGPEIHPARLEKVKEVNKKYLDPRKSGLEVSVGTGVTEYNIILK
jgi:hypothetical protein